MNMMLTILILINEATKLSGSHELESCLKNGEHIHPCAN